MDNDELRYEKYYINGEWYNNIDIEKEICKYIKNIRIFVTKESDEICVFGNYGYAHCRISLINDCLSEDFSEYLKCIAYEVENLISKELFKRGETE